MNLIVRRGGGRPGGAQPPGRPRECSAERARTTCSQLAWRRARGAAASGVSPGHSRHHVACSSSCTRLAAELEPSSTSAPAPGGRRLGSEAGNSRASADTSAARSSGRGPLKASAASSGARGRGGGSASLPPPGDVEPPRTVRMCPPSSRTSIYSASTSSGASLGAGAAATAHPPATPSLGPGSISRKTPRYRAMSSRKSSPPPSARRSGCPRSSAAPGRRSGSFSRHAPTKAATASGRAPGRAGAGGGRWRFRR